MNTFVRKEKGTAIEVFTVPDGLTLTDCFHPDIAVLFSACPANVTIGSTVDELGAWTIAPAQEQEAAVSVTSTVRHITPAAYFRRFTVSEEAAIRTAAKANMELTVLLSRVDSAKFVDLDEDEVAQGLAALVAAELLTAERAEAIRTAPVKASEILE